MHVEKQPIITIIINGFHYGFYFHDSKKQIWKIIKKWESVESRERERERERDCKQKHGKTSIKSE